MPIALIKTTRKMINFRLEMSPVLLVLVLLVNTIDLGYAATVPNKEDTFTINVTMNNYETKSVCLLTEICAS